MDKNGFLIATEKTAAVATEEVLHGMKQLMSSHLIDEASFGTDALSAECNLGELGVVATHPRLLTRAPLAALNSSHPQQSPEKQ